jgi:endogenous inhibitor of DNA gyrase (YacG/DUF329 family)
MMNKHRARQNPPSDRVNGTLPGGGDQHHGVCEACLKPLKAGKREAKRFCSPRCRLLSWAVGALAKALKEGKADGLRERIRTLGGTDKPKIKVVHTWDGGQPS